jgi:hypothetical protein
MVPVGPRVCTSDRPTPPPYSDTARRLGNSFHPPGRVEENHSSGRLGCAPQPASMLQKRSRMPFAATGTIHWGVPAPGWYVDARSSKLP